MKILFVYRNLTEFVKEIINYLKQENEIFIVSPSGENFFETESDKSFMYKINKNEFENVHDLLKPYEMSIVHSQKAFTQMKKFKEKAMPDVVIGISQGNNLFVKDAFSEIPFYYCIDGENSDYTEDANTNLYITCARAHLMSDLCYCEKAFTFDKKNYEIFSKYFSNKLTFLVKTDELVEYIKVEREKPL